MAIGDFTGQNIQDTYQRVVQTDNTNRLADGEGNIFIPISASHAITASHALFAVSASHEITFELSSSHAVSADTASFATDFEVSNDLTVNGNILLSNDSSKIKVGDDDHPSITFEDDQLTLSSVQGDPVVITNPITVIGITSTGNSTLGNTSTDTHTFNGHITASDNIWVSGSGNNIYLNNNGNITASGNISASGIISASRFNGSGGDLTDVSYNNLSFVPSGIISGAAQINNLDLTINGGTF